MESPASRPAAMPLDARDARRVTESRKHHNRRYLVAEMFSTNNAIPCPPPMQAEATP